MSASDKHLIVILGPTAVGKTDLSLKMAQYFKTEIISADSRQFYREMNIGTAKPSAEELATVPHHFIDSLSIQVEYNVAQFEKDALQCLETLFSKHDQVIMVGGSGLYIQAICQGLDSIPNVSPQHRIDLEKTWKEEGLEALQNELKANDPEYFAQVDQKNPHRLIRALEICRGTGKTFSHFRQRKPQERPFQVHKIGLKLEREKLYERINTRMDTMLAKGLKKEAEALFPQRHLRALQSVGYQEIFGHLEGKYDWEEAERLLKRNSRRYAKRQMTWFQKDPNIEWFQPQEWPGSQIWWSKIK